MLRKRDEERGVRDAGRGTRELHEKRYGTLELFTNAPHAMECEELDADDRFRFNLRRFNAED
jgi:hypothetical protein